MSNLFQLGEFELHSGQKSIFKIECDDLSDEDIECFARLVGQVSFKSVEGVPRGGLRFAKALEKYIDPDSETHLVVDDVLTTGGSIKEVMHAARDRGEEVVRGVVIFARGDCIPFVVSVFQLGRFWSDL